MNVLFTLNTGISPRSRAPLAMSPEGARFRLTLTLPLRPPSANDWHGKEHAKTREARFAYSKVRRSWSRWIPPLARPWQATSKRIVEVYRYLGRRERAFDERNRHGGMKPVEDILVEKGYLAGDRDEHVGMGFAREVMSEDLSPWTIIVVRDPSPCDACATKSLPISFKVSRELVATFHAAPLCRLCGGWGVL